MIQHDRSTVMTSANGLTLPQEIFPAFHGGGNPKAQIQNDPFTGAKISFQSRPRWQTSFAGRIGGILCQTTPPLKNRIAGYRTARKPANVSSRFVSSMEPEADGKGAIHSLD
jgi:hypothetical protein